MIQWQKSRGKLYIVDFALKNKKVRIRRAGRGRRESRERSVEKTAAAPTRPDFHNGTSCVRFPSACAAAAMQPSPARMPAPGRQEDKTQKTVHPPQRGCTVVPYVLRPAGSGAARVGRGRIRDAGNRFYRFSFFSASIGLSVLTFRMAYIMVANTTRNTLSAAMPIAVHGSRKSVW